MVKTPMDFEIVWLKEIARKIEEDSPIVHQEMMVKLREKLPAGFKPADVDRFWLYDTGLSVDGLKAIGDPSKLLPEMEQGILFIQSRLLQYPMLAKVTALELAAHLKISDKRAQRVLKMLSTVGYFSSGAALSEYGATEIHLGREEVLAEYLGFQSLEKFLELRDQQKVRLLGPPRPASVPPRTKAILSPSDGPPSSEQVLPNTAFILMNMDPNDPALVDVCDAIKAEFQAFGIHAIRIDDEESSDQITTRILDHIRTSEHIIADLSGEKPNVYYEVGYAHACGKHPILFRRSDTKLHFDLSVHNVPGYKNIAELRSKLHKRLEAILGRGPRDGKQAGE